MAASSVIAPPLGALPELSALLAMVDGTSEIHGGTNDRWALMPREGIVFKTQQRVNGRVHSFKAVSNRYLLRQP